MSRLQSSWLADLMRTDSGLKNEIGVRKLVYDLKKRWREYADDAVSDFFYGISSWVPF